MFNLPVVLTWRFGDDEPTTNPEEGSSALCHDRRRPEGTDYDSVEGSSIGRIPAEELRPLVHNGDPLLEVAGNDRSIQELDSALVGLEEHHGGFWPRSGDD
jgi:hypothetical protein